MPDFSNDAPTPITRSGKPRKKTAAGACRNVLNAADQNSNLVHAFMVQALRRYAEEVSNPTSNPDTGLWKREAFEETAEWVRAQLSGIHV